MIVLLSVPTKDMINLCGVKQQNQILSVFRFTTEKDVLAI